MPGPSYWNYLRLDRLLGLQGGLEDDESRLASDELHFIVVHQVFELWFKLILRELRLARDHLAVPRVPEERVPYVVHHLRRVNEILRLAVDQFRVMETLTPQDFLDFRDKLVPASGFQSFQMRELEILLGLEDDDRVSLGDTDGLREIRRAARESSDGDAVLQRLQQASAEIDLRTALHEWLHRTPIQGSGPDEAGDPSVVDRFLDSYLEGVRRHHDRQAVGMTATGVMPAEQVRARFEASTRQAREFLEAGDVDFDQRLRVRRIRAALVFIESYRELPLLAWPRLLVDTVVELEEQLVLWRHRHARMVERTIGRRVGTGGSSGVDYLDQTAQVRIFPELWAVRTLLLPRDELPALEAADFYGFAQPRARAE